MLLPNLAGLRISKPPIHEDVEKLGPQVGVIFDETPGLLGRILTLTDSVSDLCKIVHSLQRIL